MVGFIVNIGWLIALSTSVLAMEKKQHKDEVAITKSRIKVPTKIKNYSGFKSLKKSKSHLGKRTVKFAKATIEIEAKPNKSKAQKEISWNKFQELLKLEQKDWQEYDGTVLHHILTTQLEEIKKWRKDVEWMLIVSSLLLKEISLFEANIKRHAGTGPDREINTKHYLSSILTKHKYENLFIFDEIDDEVRKKISLIYID